MLTIIVIIALVVILGTGGKILEFAVEIFASLFQSALGLIFAGVLLLIVISALSK